MRRGVVATVAGLIALSGTACMSVVRSPEIGLQRSLYPGLTDVKPEDIPAILEKRVNLKPPISVGIAWLRESPSGSHRWTTPLSDFQRTGVLEAAIATLRKAPVSTVSALPTVPERDMMPGPASTIDAVRAAAARFQYDVAILLQTGLAEDSGLNVLAVGYLGLVTAPLFPGTDFAVASSAEACAVDVRSGIMLGCSLGRSSKEERFVFPWSLSTRRENVREETIRDAVVAASRELLQKISERVTE